MLQTESLIEIADNSGAQRILVIRCLGGSKRRYARIGDLVIATVKKAKPEQMIKKSQVVMALVIATRARFHRANKTWISFSKNYAVIVKKDEKKNYKLVGTRILVPLVAELFEEERYKEITPFSKGTI